MTHELILPCPFCGGKKVEVSRTNEDACWIECAKCGAQAKSDATRKKAIAIWNRRPNYSGYAKIVFDQDAENVEERVRRVFEEALP